MERRVYKSLDGVTRWFDESKAETFEEGRTWNGNNNISDATGSQWNHEDLYRTRKGSWVLNHWSQMGSIGTWMEIEDNEATQWLLKNGKEIPDDLSVDDLEG